MRLCLVSITLLAVAAPAQATDLNSYRAKHGRAALRVIPFLPGWPITMHWIWPAAAP